MSTRDVHLDDALVKLTSRRLGNDTSMEKTVTTPLDRLREYARRWGMALETWHETPTSVIAYGRRHTTAVVLKSIKHEGDEWHSGDVLRAFSGHGVVRVYEHAPGAVLLERLVPGDSLVDMSRLGRDQEATNIVAAVVSAMAPRAAPIGCPTVAHWGNAFERYLAANDISISRELVVRARATYDELCLSQRAPRLLHGDLQHANILFDGARGWVAIDPKGVVGELEYDMGALLRNPHREPSVFANPRVIERRVTQLTTALHLDSTRVLRWAFAQAVLSAIWEWEDTGRGAASAPVLVLAGAIDAMLALG